ncbi:MAG: efflux RND transporter periplasmic adaptor subunit, partial [Cyanobacteriota bacterium]|nr:efflux RND transporter periplasmic adaptor subunit [Cyanobacteriota bacterium]
MDVLPPGKPKRSFPWFLAALVGGITAVAIASSVAVWNAVRPRPELDELTVPATEEALTARIQASGTVLPIESVNISPQNSGRLIQLQVEQGDMVEQGQILAVMENDQIQARGLQATANLQQAIANLNAAQVRIPGEIAQARARYNQALARLQESRASLPRQTDRARAGVASAQSRFELARERLNSNQILVREGAISRDRFFEVANEFRLAQANLFEAQQSLAETQNTNAPEIRQLEAAVVEAKAALEQREKTVQQEIAQLEAAAGAAQAQLQQVQLEYQKTGIRAPFAGIVTQKYANPGAFVTPTTSASSTASATSSSIIALARGLEIVAKVPEVDVGQLQPGQPVEIIADAYPDKVFRGLVKRVAPEAVVEQNVTSFEVRVAVDDKAEEE